MTKSRGILSLRKPWTDHELEFVRRDYPHMKTEKLAKNLGRAVATVYRMAFKLGIHKTAEYLASDDACQLRGKNPKSVEHQFKPGQAAFNKGLRRPPGWSPGRMAEGQFKKGHRGNKFLPVGSERLSKDGILQRKISATGHAPRDWVSVHRLVWEEVNGPVPAGCVIVFKDRNRSNLALDNLQCITLAENCRRNSHHNNYPKEICQLIQLRGAIQRQLNKRERKRREEQN